MTVAQLLGALLILAVVGGIATLVALNIGRTLPSRGPVPSPSPTVPVLPTAAVTAVLSPSPVPTTTPTPTPGGGADTPPEPPPPPEAHVANTGGSGIYLRADPGANGAVVTTLSEGATVQLTGQTQTVAGTQWTQVQTSSGATGWVASTYLDTTS